MSPMASLHVGAGPSGHCLGQSLAPPLLCRPAGAAFTLPAGFLAVLSGGAGHGHYEFARLFFPAEMLATHLTSDTITASVMIAAILQFPIYGALIGYSLARRKLFWIIVVIGVHLLAATACFFGAVPNFS